ncbi:MAG: CNP1-like family protein [Thiobacillaceae bacterium]
MNKLIILVLSLASWPALADTGNAFIYGDSPENAFEDSSRPWAEVQAQLPAYPRQENLVRFNVSSATDNTYSIDTASISIGKDDVVRYTVVIESPRGARTVNYEGMRCDPTEFKVYAFGHPDNTWSKNRYAKWEEYRLRSLLSYHKALFEDDFCPNGLQVRTKKEAIRNLKQAQP